jgi:biopolymer transport protein ExbD
MKFRRQTKRKVAPNVDLTPLIDVVFQLLIFFMVTSTFVMQTAVPVEVAETSAAEQISENRHFTITLMAGEGGPEGAGKVFLFDGTSDLEVETWEYLEGRLAELRQAEENPVVHIRPDKGVSSGRLLHVAGLVVAAEIKQYAFVAQPPAQDE